jgi:subtilase family protein
LQLWVGGVLVFDISALPAPRARLRTRTVVRGIRWKSWVPVVAVVLLALTTVVPVVGASTRAVRESGKLVRVVVRATPGATNVADAILSVGGVVERPIAIIDGYSALLPASGIGVLRATTGIASVSEDERLHLMSTTYSAGNDPYSLYQVQQDLGARGMWGKKFTGAGIDIALIDSGVTPVVGLDGAGKIVYGPDLTEESQNPATANLDTFGHGTFMAGIIAGHDAGVDPVTKNGSSAAFMGFAPDARIVSVKVADAHGATDVSQVLAGIDWVVQHAHDPGMNIRVLNLSFGTDSSQSYTVDPLAYAVEVAWRAGILVVTSAGNSGAVNGRLTLPAVDPFVLAVGADDTKSTSSQTDDTIPSFSSVGDGTRNPDVVMPGVHMQSLRVQGSYVDAQYASSGAINDRFMRGSGTSEAAAAASGSVALLMSEYPSATPDQLKALLVSTASRLPSADPQAQGAGLVNLRNASGKKPPVATQTFVRSIGTGSLNASRGSAHLEVNGVVLSGEQDVFGSAVDSTALATAEANDTAWQGGIWNGVRWSGDDWSGIRWSGAVWSGCDWTGVRWSSDTWSNGSWDGVRWSGTTWASATWDGMRWSGMRWSSDSWSTDSWS